ncbi:MAG: hypothetical protein JXM68_08840, partial [Sedimentisphaerales bacterium]|nr:hypothetical protein [Sedimentisphaerales bacterium]
MANGLSRIIKKARKANETNILARLAQKKFRVEELEDRIAPAAGDIGGTGDVAGRVVTLDADGETATLELGTDTWTLTGTSVGGGEIVVTFGPDADGATTITSIDFGTGGAITGAAVLTIDSTGTTDGLTITSIIDGVDNSGTVSVVGGSDAEADMVTVGTVVLDQTGIATWNTGDITSLTAETVATSMRVGDVATSIATTTSFAGTLTVTGSLGGTVTSANGIGAIVLEAGSTAAGDITATTGSITSVTLGDGSTDSTLTFAGDIKATAGAIGAIAGTDETSITISGAIIAGTDIGAVGNAHINGITGAITGQTIASITTSNGNVSGAVEASGGAGTIGAINIGTGVLSGAVTASGTTGSIGAITAGSITGDVTATDTDSAGTDNTIGALAIGGAVSGDISGYSIADLAITGALSGTITSASGFDAADNTLAIGSISSAGALVATANGIGATDTLTISGDMDGSITVVADDLAGAISITGDMAGSIETTAGSITGNVTIGGDLTADGSITAGVDVSGDIIADDLIGTITVTENLIGSVTASDATDGSIDALIVTGTIAPTGGATISAAGGNVVLTAGAIAPNGGTLTVSATADVTVTVNGTDFNGTVDGAIDATGGAVTIISDSADKLAHAADNSGDITVTTNYMITGAAGVVFFGDDVTITMNAMGFDNGDAVIGDIEANGTVTITGATDALTLGDVESFDGAIAAISAGGALSVTGLTAATGIGAITAEGALTVGATGINATAGGIGAITAEGDITLNGSIVADAGNIGAITASDGEAVLDVEDITIANGEKIEATAGTVGAIYATGDIDAAAGTATIVAGAQVAVSGVVLSITDNSVVYTVESDNAVSTDLFALTYTITAAGAFNNKVTLASTRTTNTALNLSLAT